MSFWGNNSPRIILPLLLCVLAGSFFLNVSRHVAAQEKENQIQPEIDVISQSYCQSEENPGIGHLRFELKATFRNEGQRPVILCKKYLPYGTPNLYEVESDGSVGPAVDFPIYDSYGYDMHYPKSLSKDYVILPRGDSTAVTVVTEIYFRADPADPYHHSLPGPGRYFLGIAVETWGGTPDTLINLQKRWETHGDLIGVTLYSNPLLVSINPPKELPVCKIQ